MQQDSLRLSVDLTIKDYFLRNSRIYMGLQNLGNTCYMNSLLQTLFMTPQFREALFRWQYVDEKHPAQQDCIPLQLQLLFARMQVLSKEVKQADTRKLIQSFQWDSQESFQQHDVQEFCRVLFDAIQQSCSEEKEFIGKLYESHSESYVKCLKCQTESVRSDMFMDLSLTVKSEFDGVYNDSLEMALKHYLKPDQLSGSNLYMCETCQEKVEAIKGLRFSQLSEILTIQLNRFDLDMETFDRKKVNNWVSYPFILDMNKFMLPYDKIVVEDDRSIAQERERLIDLDKAKDSIQVDNFDDPLKRPRRLNRRPSPETTKKSDVLSTTSAVKDDFEAAKLHVEEQLVNESIGNDSQVNVKANLKKSCEQLGQKFDSLKKLSDPPKKVASFTTSNNPNLIMTADEAYDLDNDMLFGSKNFELKDLQSKLEQSDRTTHLDDDDDIINEIQEESHQQGIEDKIKKYLLNGPYVYELYSVMIHSGGAQGGHYYAYIKSFENDRWYCFNDSTVDRIKWKQVLNMFGEKLPKFNTGVSAYFLMYTQVALDKRNQIPQLSSELEQQLQSEVYLERIKKEKEEYEKKEKALELRIRVFYKHKDNVVKCKKSDTLNMLKEECIKALNVQEEPENFRLRFYNCQDQFMLDTFTGREKQTLQELSFNDHRNVFIQTKDSNQVFEDYDPRLVMLKINVWRPDIQELDENHLLPHRIYIKDDKRIPDLVQMIAETCTMSIDKIILQRRQTLGQMTHTEILNTPHNSTKSFFHMNIVNCLNLYVEEAESKWITGNPTKWDSQFEADKFRCTIIYNDPRSTQADQVPEYAYEISIDSRLPLFDLKERIGYLLNIDVDNFIIKRGSRFNAELKDLTTAIKDNGIIGRGTIYLLNGQPSLQGQHKINVGLGGLSKLKTDSIEYDYEDLFQIVISNNQSVYQLKEILCKEIVLKHNIVLNPNRFRLREKVGMKLGRVFHNQDSLKIYKIYDRQHFVIEQLNQEEETVSGQYLTYVKFFNLMDFDLSYPPQEFFLTQTTTLQEFVILLSQKFEIPIEAIEACKITNIYNFSIDDLVLTSYDWLSMHEIDAELGKQPWYFMKDSNFLVVRDNRAIPEDFVQIQERAKETKLKKASITDSSFQSSANTPTKNSLPKEKALVIKVVKKVPSQFDIQSEIKRQTDQEDDKP